MGNAIEADIEVIKINRPYIDMVELRLDKLDDPLAVHPDIIKQKFDIPSIITYRKKIDGGNYEGSEIYRKSVLYEYSKTGFNYIDLEMETSFSEVEKSCEENGITIIRSYHNFSVVPDNLEGIIRQLSSKPGEIAKVAVYPGSSSETFKFFEVFEKVKDIKDKIILGMGEFGLPTRILYKKLGSIITYCSSTNNSGAPGQLSPVEMKNLYQGDKIRDNTSIYGIIGNPVMHTRSPELHNKAYKRANINAVYIPFLVDSIHFFLQLAKLLEIDGFSVTVPFKVDILKILDEKSPEINSIQSCNTVIKKGKFWKGFNTDFNGFLKPLLSVVDASKIVNCAVIGAGGASRAVIAALKSISVEVSIFNRSIKRASKLAAETGSFFYPITRVDLLNDFDLIVQTTSVGMTPRDNETPLPEYKFRAGQIVYDVIYTPLKTRFLKEAEAAGSVIIGGMEMLNTQGIEQFEIFMNQPYPLVEQKENS